MIKLIKRIASIYALLLLSTIANASNVDLHKTSDDYQVYLGIVPAERIKQNPYLVDNDVKIHGGVQSKGKSSYHVMVAIFDFKTNKRIEDATVIAEVTKKSILSGSETEKPLQKMVTSGTVTYGNFFDMDKKNVYEIKVSVYRPNINGKETFEFVYEPY